MVFWSFFWLSVLSSSIIHTTLSFKIVKDGCNIDISKLDPEPIVVTSDTHEFIYPLPDEDSIFLNTGDTIIVACPGSYLTINSNQYSIIEAQCTTDNTLVVDDESVDFDSLSCSEKVSSTARYTGLPCELDGKQIEIGFELSDAIFIQQILICFDDVAQNTLYAVDNITKSIGSREANVERPAFVEGDFYNVGKHTVNSLYTKAVQRTTINALLGLSASSTKYIASTGNNYLARGHYSAKAEFVYSPQQRATFYYVNAGPQWQAFNGNNWRFAEENVRDYAEANSLKLLVYTGSHGIATLPHEETGEATELYLYVAEDGTTALPVPQLYWKVVYDPESKAGVALVGINNPYIEDVSASIICTDVSESITWLTWKNDDIAMGYSYVCTVDELMETVKQIPDLEVSGLLV